MKIIKKILFVVLSSFWLISCNKTSIPTIIGKWDVVNDSITSGVGPFIHQQNYIGLVGDYFDFRTDGKVYIKENSSFDTLNYKAYFAIKTLTAHNANVHHSLGLNPGGVYERTVNLRR